MAIGAGSIVSAKTSGGGGHGFPVQGPLFGVVESGADPYVVLWYSGLRTTAVAATTIDEILDGTTATQNALVGRRVQISTPTGQNNWGICTCVAVYKRSGVDYALLQNPIGEYFLEVLASVCVAVQ